MKKHTLYIITIVSFLLSSSDLFSEIKLTWNATANETKHIHEIVGEYNVNWGDGTTDATTAHTYATTGDYTVVISGTVSTLDLRGDGTYGESGLTSFSVSQEDNNLQTLNIWGNSSLTEMDVRKAKALSALDLTLVPVISLDLSGNTALTKLDLKRCGNITELTLPNAFPSMNMVDVNSSSLPACQLNALFNALPTASGTLYAVGCDGDATSDPTIATNKGWKFENGGNGDGSAICVAPLMAIKQVNVEKSNDNFIITWNEVGDAENYTVKVKEKTGTACEATFYESDTESLNIPVMSDPTAYEYYIYTNRGITYAEAGPFNFIEGTTAVDELETSLWTVATAKNQISVIGAEQEEEITLYNLQGVIVKSKKAEYGETTFNCANGIYVVKVGDKHRKVVVE